MSEPPCYHDLRPRSFNTSRFKRREIVPGIREVQVGCEPVRITMTSIDIVREEPHNFAGKNAVHGFDLQSIGIRRLIINVLAKNGSRPAGESGARRKRTQILAHGAVMLA